MFAGFIVDLVGVVFAGRSDVPSTSCSGGNSECFRVPLAAIDLQRQDGVADACQSGFLRQVACQGAFPAVDHLCVSGGGGAVCHFVIILWLKDVTKLTNWA